MNETELLTGGLDLLGITWSEIEREKLELYLTEIVKWNRHINLVKADMRDLVIKHVLDSLAALHHLTILDNRNRIADIGSGAGFPGIPLSLFMTDSSFFLIERSQKRAGFLRRTVNLMGLKNVTVFEYDLKSISDSFDLTLLRAFKKLSSEEMLDIVQLTAPGGTVAAYKGKIEKIRGEVRDMRLKGCVISIIQLNVPYLQAERHLVLLKKRDREIPMERGGSLR